MKTEQVGFAHLLYDTGRLAVEVGHVRTVGPLPSVTPVPGSDPAVRGVAPVRGATVTVLDPAVTFDEGVVPGSCDRLLVARPPGASTDVGLPADAVRTRTHPVDALEPTAADGPYRGFLDAGDDAGVVGIVSVEALASDARPGGSHGDTGTMSAQASR